MIVVLTYQKLNSYASSYNRCLSFIRYFQRTFFGRTWTYLFVCYSFYRGQWIGRWLFICLLLFRLGLVACRFFYYSLIVCDGSRGGFVVVFFSFHFFRSGSMEGDGWGRLVAALLAPSRPSAQASRCQKESSC